LTEAAITTVGNDILHALISKNPKHATMKDLPRNLFLESEEQNFLRTTNCSTAKMHLKVEQKSLLLLNSKGQNASAENV
jgi:hypothetical protein